MNGTQGPRVVNLHHEPNIFRQKNAVYIGRPKKGDPNKHFGNPFSHLPHAQAIKVDTREDSIIANINWLEGTAHQNVEPERRLWILENLHLIREADAVVCFCSPQGCHGNSLVEKALGKPMTRPSPEKTSPKKETPFLDLDL